MAEKSRVHINPSETGKFKEAVCVNIDRIFDSCGDKDCIEDLQVNFPASGQKIIDDAICVKPKKASVIGVYLSIEPVTVNKGFYAVDITFFFNVELETYSSPVAKPVCVEGLACFNKRVILFGASECVKIFSGQGCGMAEDKTPKGLPKVKVKVLDPMILSAKLCECCKHNYQPVYGVPSCISDMYDSDFCDCIPDKGVYVTLGLFSVVSLEREVDMCIPAYEYCMPYKECVCREEDPCDIFKKIKFPTDKFFPQSLCAGNDDLTGCACR